MMRATGVAVVGSTFLLALAVACSSGLASSPTSASPVTSTRGAPSSGPPSSSSPVGAVGSPATSSTRSNADPSRPITLAFGGDVNFEGRVAHLLDGGDGLADLRPVLGGADVAMVNLETAITDRGTPQPKIYHFRTSPQALVTLQKAGVDGVSMANNHAVDFGADGLTDTLAAQQSSPIPVIGIGRDAAKAFAPAVFTVRGVTVAVIASTQVNDYTVNTYPATDTRAGVAGNLVSNDRLVTAVRVATQKYDVVAVFLHWGTDYTSCPDGPQQRTAAALEEAGADVVVGGHAHRVQGAGRHGRTYVDYGLGNFVWLNTRSEIDTRSGVLTVSIDPAAAMAQGAADPNTRHTRPSVVTGVTWTPLVVGDDGVPRAPAAATSASLQQAWADARSCAGLTP